MRRALSWLSPLAVAVPPVLALVAATGCGTEQTDAVADEGRTMMEITIENGRAEQAGGRVEVSTGESVELVVMADSTGQIHVHSDPEEAYTYEPGTTTFTVEMTRPGLVDVELHGPDQLLLQLEVH